MSAAPVPQTFQLSDASAGQLVTITALGDGPELRRAAELGLVPGTPVAIRRAAGRGAVIVHVRGATLAIDRAVSAGIAVVAQQ